MKQRCVSISNVLVTCVCVPQSHQCPPRGAVEENAERGAARLHPAGQSARRRAEEAQPRLLETQANELCKNTHDTQLHRSEPCPALPFHLFILSLSLSSRAHKEIETAEMKEEPVGEHTYLHTFTNHKNDLCRAYHNDYFIF